MWYRKILLLMLFTLFAVITVKADAISTMETNLNMSIADVIMVVVSGGIVIVGALDARIALMFAFLVYTSIFILFTLVTEEGITGFNPYYSGVAMMVCFVLLCLMLLVSYKKANTPLGVV